MEILHCPYSTVALRNEWIATYRWLFRVMHPPHVTSRFRVNDETLTHTLTQTHTHTHTHTRTHTRTNSPAETRAARCALRNTLLQVRCAVRRHGDDDDADRSLPSTPPAPLSKRHGAFVIIIIIIIIILVSN